MKRPKVGADEGGGSSQTLRSRSAGVPPSFVSVAIDARSVTKKFAQTVALDATTLQVRRGTVHALLGENGAGKTTLMRIIFGMIPPDEGTITINGETRHFHSPADAIASGIGMVHQHFMLVPAMTVAENLALGKRGRYNATQAREDVRVISERYGLPIDPEAVVGTLPVGAQQRVEVLKALRRNASILILDEPTAVLTPGEARELLQKMREFVATGGTVVLITHKLRDAMEFSDEVTVLRRGRTVLAEPTRGVDEQVLMQAMIGTGDGVLGDDRMRGSLATAPQRARPPHAIISQHIPSQPVFELRQVTVRDTRGVERLKNVSISIEAGEIVGVAAVEGNGQAELLRVLAGRIQTTGVTVPRTVGFVPEDRHRDAAILDFPLYENVVLMGAGERRGRIDWGVYRQRTDAVIAKYDVRVAGVRAKMRELSGGNQQKFVVGREMEGAPEAIVVESPTRGLDVQAMEAVHRQLREARDRGAAIVVYSNDLDEVLELADRIVVVYEGEVREVPKDREIVGQAMLGSRE